MCHHLSDPLSIMPSIRFASSTRQPQGSTCTYHASMSCTSAVMSAYLISSNASNTPNIWLSLVAPPAAATSSSSSPPPPPAPPPLLVPFAFTLPHTNKERTHIHMVGGRGGGGLRQTKIINVSHTHHNFSSILISSRPLLVFFPLHITQSCDHGMKKKRYSH